ncbi:YihY/virulence factor BrkB family protein [Levilactobacillus bambusae]|uniref:YihY/virulence factor BrkB family protein n=1 Tax=Levilactobacillus bambusae TaxID=2024736 RepID=A0A2V1MY44_9LACO|nr:YihY/virulence factor BrkB family protein [Levilactobacillus bambusae]PWF99908.1 YihY/virulence factor BrkB family protein [Levilactobacillus bambusae]
MSEKTVKEGAWQQFKDFVGLVVKHYTMAQVSDSAVVLAYYLLLSIFPALLFIGNLLPLLNINANHVLDYIEPMVPSTIFQTLEPIVRSFLTRGSGGAFSIGLIVTLWSASRAVAAFQRTVNRAYGVAPNQNAIWNRVISFIWMSALIIIMIIAVLFFSFGQLIMEKITPLFHLSAQPVEFISSVKWPLTFTMLFLLLLVLYYFVPSAKVRWKFVWAGALIATTGWLLLSQLFTLYVKYFAQNIDSYKTIGTFIVIMLWLDFSGVILMFGGVINATLQEMIEGAIEEQAGLYWLHASRRQINRIQHRANRKIKRQKKHK